MSSELIKGDELDTYRLLDTDSTNVPWDSLKDASPIGYGASIVVSDGVTSITRRREAGLSDIKIGRYAKCRTPKLF